MGTKADATAHREYLEALMAAVQDARERGLPLAQAKEEITLNAYRDWSQYDAWREENIEGMYLLLSEK
jgi:post-segregation antitoxin (ccd killing protein)